MTFLSKILDGVIESMQQPTNSPGVEHTTKHEEEASANWMAYLREAVSEYNDAEEKRVADWLLRSASPPDMVRRVRGLMYGTWKSDLALAAATLAGLGLGFLSGSRVPVGAPIPIIALVGVGGLLPRLFWRQGMLKRSVSTLGGLMFVAGAFFGARDKRQALAHAP